MDKHVIEPEVRNLGCFDVILPREARAAADALAIKENPANDPESSARQAGDDALLNFMALETKKMWKPGRTLNVYFMNGSLYLQNRIFMCARTWCDWANINFVRSSNPNAEIRVNIGGKLSWSLLGTDCLSIEPGKPTMNFGWFTDQTDDMEISRTTLHEFGHALGCIHEHQNPTNGIVWNKEAAYEAYSKSDDWTREQVDAQVFQTYSRDRTQFTATDANSIMMYPISKELTLNGFSSQNNCFLSQTDKAFIAEMYPSPDQPIVFILSPNGKYKFECRTDGLLTHTRTSDGRILWMAPISLLGRMGRCVMQHDGNLVIYDLSRNAIWSSNTYNNPGATLAVQDDGNVVIYSSTGKPLWSTNTWQG